MGFLFDAVSPDLGEIMTTGLKHDQDKPRLDLVDPKFILGVAAIVTFGARKYAAEAWKTVPHAKRRYGAALLRHVLAKMNGEDLDPESGLPHIDHAACNLMFLRWLDENGKPELDVPCGSQTCKFCYPGETTGREK